MDSNFDVSERPAHSPEHADGESYMVPLRDISRGKEPIRSLSPDFRALDVHHIDFKRLHEKFGIEVFAFDVDNTLTDTNASSVHPAFQEFLLEQMTTGHIPRSCLATDSTRDMTAIAAFMQADRIPTPKLIRKISPQYWRYLIKQIGVPPSKIAMIGDSPWWDIRGANTVGITTVLVDPFSDYTKQEKLVRKKSMDSKARIELELEFGNRFHPPRRSKALAG